MADSKIKPRPEKLLKILPFILITALVLIIIGIILSSFPTEMTQTEVLEQRQTIDYTNCKYVKNNITCEDFFKHNTKADTHCQCFVQTNLTENLRGNVNVYSQLEILKQQNSNNSGDLNTTYINYITNISGQCDPYKIENTGANESCDAIPDSVFNDYIQLYAYNSTTNQYDLNVARFNKSVRWSLGQNNSEIGLQNYITVLMNGNWSQKWPDVNVTGGLSAGPYLVYLYRFYRNDQIARRSIIFSTKTEVVHTLRRSNAIEIIVLVIGLVFLAVAIALFILRNRIAGTESNTASAALATDERTANNRVSGFQSEEKPLAAHSTDNDYL